MADEIDQIKATLLSISSRISDLPSQPDLRFGMVAYRDRGDDFVTQVYDFEPDPQRFVETIRGVVAHGGGDYPESLNEALHVAVHEPEWRPGDAIRLMFLIADAPPQLGYQDDYSYADDMIEAHQQGIKTFSIASSGLEPAGRVRLPPDRPAHDGPLHLHRLRRGRNHFPQRERLLRRTTGRPRRVAG